MSGKNVSEIHAYPLRPDGFEEPLFPTAASKRAIAEHLLEAPWLRRASELERRTGQTAHALREPVVFESPCEGVKVVRLRGGRRCAWRRRRVAEVLDRWREVGGWWDVGSGVDRMVFRVLLSGGGVIDLARERSGGRFLVGIVD